MKKLIAVLLSAAIGLTSAASFAAPAEQPKPHTSAQAQQNKAQPQQA